MRIEQTTLEHVIPRSKGGSDNILNLKLSCHRCNTERGDADFHEYQAWVYARIAGQVPDETYSKWLRRLKKKQKKVKINHHETLVLSNEPEAISSAELRAIR